jgi:hypothetical protein
LLSASASSDNSSARVIILASVFCASGTDDDAALENRMGTIVDYGAEDLAADAVRHGMVDEQAWCRMLAAVEQIDAVGLDPEPSPAKNVAW